MIKNVQLFGAALNHTETTEFINTHMQTYYKVCNKLKKNTNRTHINWHMKSKLTFFTSKALYFTIDNALYPLFFITV